MKLKHLFNAFNSVHYKSILFILFSLHSLNSFAQFDSVVVYHTYSYSEPDNNQYGLSFRYENHYDSLGRVFYYIYDNWDGFHFAHNSKINYFFDSNGRSVETVTSAFYNGAWTNTNRQKVFYNSFNKVDSTVNYIWSNGWVSNYGTYDLYNANHFLISELYLETRILHWPDAFGRDTLILTQQNWSGSWTDYDKQKIHYGANGLKDYTIAYADDGSGTFIPNDSITLSYYANDSLRYQSYYHYLSSVAALSSTDSIIYSGDSTITYQREFPSGVFSNRKISYYHDNFNYYYVDYSLFNGTVWHDYPAKRAYIDSVSSTGHSYYSDWGSDSTTTIYDNDWHIISQSYAGETHSEYAYYGDRYYYYYLTNGDDYVCPGQHDSLWVVQGLQSYSWNNGSNQSSIIVQPVQEYHCNVVNQYGHAFQSEPHFPFMTLRPTAEKSIDSSVIICPNQYGFKLSHSDIPVYEYQWYRNDTAMIGYGNTPTLNFSSYNFPKIDGEYKLVISNGCGSDTSSTTTVHFDTLQVRITCATTQICPGDTVYSSASPGFSSYHWNTGDTSRIVANYEGHLNSQVITTDSIGCGSGDYLNITMMFPANQMPPKIFLQGDTILAGSLQLNGTYQWYRNGVAIPGATTRFDTLIQSGNYYYTYTIGGCTIQSETKFFYYAAYRVHFYSDTIKFCAGQPFNYIANAYYISGGQPGYTYNWTPATGLSNSTVPNPTISTTSDVDYILTVTDGSGHVSSDTIHIAPRPFYNFAVTASADSICPQINSSVILSIPNLGAGEVRWFRNNSNFTSNGHYSTTVFSGGNYYVTFNNGCISTSNTINIPVYPDFPASAIHFDSIPTNWCTTSTADISLVIPNPQDYTYSWHSYSSPFVSVNGPNATISSGGEYGVYVTDFRGCRKFVYFDTAIETGQTTISADLIPDGIVIACLGDTVHLSCANVPGATYSWHNYGNDLNTYTNQYNAIYSGNYRVSIDYGYSCHARDSVYVSYGNINSTIDVVYNGYNLLANTLTGYVSTYQWYFNNTPIPGAIQSTFHPTTPGWYKLIVNGGSNCGSAADSVLINCAVASVVTQPDCFNSCNGSINITPSGNAPFSINWSTGDTANSLSNLCNGYFLVNVTDQFGCVASDSIHIVEPDSISMTNNVIQPTCFNLCNGEIIINATGGMPPYSYFLNGLSTSSFAQNICAGTYNLVVTDNTGCTKSAIATVAGGAPITISDSVNNASCNICSDGYAVISILGGAPPITVAWSTGDTTLSLSGVPVGIYVACITDQSSCTVCDTVTISFSIGISDAKGPSINAYPNPFDKFIVIDVSNSNDGDYISLTNAVGEIIDTKLITANRITIAGEVFANGIYLMELKNKRGETLSRKKIISMH
jgi:hypothetical protein